MCITKAAVRGWHHLGGSREGLEGECQAWGAFCSWQILLYSSGHRVGGTGFLPWLQKRTRQLGWDSQGRLGSHRDQAGLGSHRAGINRAGIRQGWFRVGAATITRGLPAPCWCLQSLCPKYPKDSEDPELAAVLFSRSKQSSRFPAIVSCNSEKMFSEIKHGHVLLQWEPAAAH